MSFSRVGVRNVYGGMSQQAEFYGNVDREDPEAILNGVAVSGLIGVLRQLGDLAESAAEIFQSIQEEVMATASRSNQLKIRLQRIEATVSPLEKAVLAQTTHLHFAYTGGVEWHPRIPQEQNHLIHDDLPHFIMDPYEECRDPPRLHMLDKFDINGPGSCLKRYSDPTYFRRASGNLIQGNKKFQNKNSKIKKKKPSSRSRDMSRLASMANQTARKTFASFSFSGQTSSSKTASTSDMDKRSDVEDHHSHSFDSRSGSGYIECLSTAEKPKGVLVSSSLTPGSCTIASVLSECETEDGKDSLHLSPTQGQAAAVGSSCVSWDEKAEIVEPLGVQTDVETNSVVEALDEKASYGEGTSRVDFHSKKIENAKSESVIQQCTVIDEVREIKASSEIMREPRDSEHETESEGEFFVDALNSIESESENDQGLKTSQQAVSSHCGVTGERLEKSVCEKELEQSSNGVEESCRSMDNGSVNAADEMKHQDPLESTNISGGEDNMACTLVPAPENSLSVSSNPLDHSDHQKPEAEVSREVEAIKIWTNGSLLGLNPSKPPVLEVPSSISSAEAEKDKSDDVVEHVLDNTSSLSAPGTQNLTVDQRECHETSYGVFGGLSQKLFTNSFRRRDSSSHDNRQALPATIPENNEAATTTEKSRFLFRDEAPPIDWFTSSPPLQHMKISLNPVDTLQASRLKLKFSDEDNNNIKTFTSFQLLPEASTSLLDSCSDDDDTFCRSSPCTSDIDYVSDYHSLSDSEQWEESSHSHERKEQELHGEASCQETEAENGCVALNFSYLQSPVDPLPPPFPPAQWMVSKTASETISDNKTTQSLQLQDALRFAFEKHTSSSIVNKEEPNAVTSSAPKPETKVDHVKNNVREDKQNAKEKETDAEDFLQQIRTQHVNLRPVVMTTTLSSAAAATTDPAINIKISAMLEKANSIRQAVASNDGDESDTWSDT